MNKQRRKSLTEAYDKLAEVQEAIEFLRDEEQDAFDNLPEGIQESERGEQMQGYIDSMDSALSSLEEAADYLNEVLL